WHSLGEHTLNYQSMKISHIDKGKKVSMQGMLPETLEICYLVEDTISCEPYFCPLSKITADWKALISAEYAKHKFASDVFEGEIRDEKYKVTSKMDKVCNISMKNIIFRSPFIILADWHKEAAIMKDNFQIFKALWVTIEALSAMVTSIGSDMQIFRYRLSNSRRLGAAVDGQPGNQVWVFQTPHLRQPKDLLQQ
ncbi:hypothetical protein KI387_039459, partial [Taxus chinensis]